MNKTSNVEEFICKLSFSLFLLILSLNHLSITKVYLILHGFFYYCNYVQLNNLSNKIDYLFYDTSNDNDTTRP